MLFHVYVIGRGLVPNPQNEGDPDPILDLEVTTYTDPGKLIPIVFYGLVCCLISTKIGDQDPSPSLSRLVGEGDLIT